jgi:hypothetical protein
MGAQAGDPWKLFHAVSSDFNRLITGAISLISHKAIPNNATARQKLQR